MEKVSQNTNTYGKYGTPWLPRANITNQRCSWSRGQGRRSSLTEGKSERSASAREPRNTAMKRVRRTCARKRTRAERATSSMRTTHTRLTPRPLTICMFSAPICYAWIRTIALIKPSPGTKKHKRRRTSVKRYEK